MVAKELFILSAMQCGVHCMYNASVRDYTDIVKFPYQDKISHSWGEAPC